MLYTELHDQKTVPQLLQKFRQQSGHKTSGKEAADKYMVSSGKAKQNTLTAESWQYNERIMH